MNRESENGSHIFHFGDAETELRASNLQKDLLEKRSCASYSYPATKLSLILPKWKPHEFAKGNLKKAQTQQLEKKPRLISYQQISAASNVSNRNCCPLDQLNYTSCQHIWNCRHVYSYYHNPFLYCYLHLATWQELLPQTQK